MLWEKALVFLVSTIGQSVVDTWRKKSEVETHLSNLRVALPKAQLLIERAECWRLPIYNPIDNLLSQLKDSVYGFESILDELQYQSLKHKVEKRSIPGTKIIVKWIEEWMRDFPTAVKKVLDTVNNVHNGLKEACDNRGIPENPNRFSQNARPITSSRLASTVYGRDEELNKVICLMGIPTSESGKRKRAKGVGVSNSDIGASSSRMDEKRSVSVLPIVGMGGVGKTTLAQMVCTDKTVKSYFDLIMWVCVSENFDLVKLTKEIIESATTMQCNLTNLDSMQNALQNELNTKKFLLVLDDVWSNEWHSVLPPIMEGASEGSVVMVTTRSPECVKIQGTSIGSEDVINLEGLEENIYWDFFKSCAFNSVVESNNINQELEDIGKSICKRLKGSPLAAKTIGAALENNSSVEHWRNIKDSKMWKLQEKQGDILPVLQLSYQYLPTYLKKCFSFCSLYPKDFKFTQSELTEFWIMQGFIGPLDNDKELRTLAKGYFADLERRAFFQRLGPGTDSGYVIHDLMHDVCLSITKDECFCLENGHSEQNVALEIRHSSVFQKKVLLKEQKELCKYKKLLSLKVGPNSCCITGLETWCNDLKNIRSLSLAKCKNIQKLPENIGNLKHLQFLDISGTNFETLPESFCKLYNLKYLNMMDCSKITSFPKGFNNLVNLQLFYLPMEKVSLVERFENIGKAILVDNLRLYLGGNNNIEMLKNICKLRGSLYIHGLENVRGKEAAQKAQLNEKPLINRLELNWLPGRDYREHDNEVLDGLCPHHNLKELKIECYRGRNLSHSWLKEEFLPNLTVVELMGCKFSTISHLPCFITKLVITYCSQLENLQNLLEPNHLPELKHIEVNWCDNLESLSVESFGGFELLEHLTINGCAKLRSPNAMVLPTSVKYLFLKDCGELEKSIPSCLQNLTSLEYLTIRDCQHLVSIPSEVTSNLKSLSGLSLYDCANLQSVGGLQFLASLQHISIWNCPKLDETGGRVIDGKLPSVLLKGKARK